MTRKTVTVASYVLVAIGAALVLLAPGVLRWVGAGAMVLAILTPYLWRAVGPPTADATTPRQGRDEPRA